MQTSCFISLSKKDFFNVLKGTEINDCLQGGKYKKFQVS